MLWDANQFNPNRPNTGVSDKLLSSGNVILCCSEDYAELSRAISPLVKRLPKAIHKHRCFSFTQYSDFTLVWTDIGTGCIETLLWEILEDVSQIILVGTAGLIEGTTDKLDRVYLVEKSFFAGSGVQAGPNFPKSTLSTLPSAEGISSDYYYGFSKSGSPRSLVAQALDHNLSNGIASTWQPNGLTDMEVGQFYHYCKIYGKPDLHYLAIMGVTNAADNHTEHTYNSRAVLRTAAREAIFLLGADEAPSK